MATHHIAQDRLPVLGAFEVFGRLVPGFVFVDFCGCGEVLQLERHRATHRKVDQIVVHEGHPGLEAVRHAELVLDDEEAVEKRLRLKIEGVVDVVLGPTKAHVTGAVDVAKDVSCPYVLHVAPDRGKRAFDLTIGNEAVPIHVVLVDVVLEVATGACAKITPGIAGKQFVTAGSGQHDFDELARELGDIVIGITLADARFFEMACHARQAALHVAGLEHHLVVLRLAERRHCLGLHSFVGRQLKAGSGAEIESACERLQARQLT